MWVGLLTERINNKLWKSNLIDELALNREPVPLMCCFPLSRFLSDSELWEQEKKIAYLRYFLCDLSVKRYCAIIGGETKIVGQVYIQGYTI